MKQPDTPECAALWENGWNHTLLWELSQKLERERDEARRKCADLEAMIERMKKQLTHALEAIAENRAARKQD